MTLALPRLPRQSAALVVALCASASAPAYALGPESVTSSGSAAGLPPMSGLGLAIGNDIGPAVTTDAAPVHVAQSKEQAALLVRIQDLEGQVRTLTGQIEGLQFQLTQMQQLIDRMTQDNEARFEALEGTTGKSPPAPTAAPASNGTPSGSLTDGQGSNPAQPPAATADAAPATAPLPPLAADGAGDTTTGQPMDDDTTQAPLDLGLGNSQDPMLRGGSPTLGTLSEDSLPAGTPSADVSASSADARAQYQAGYDAMTRGDYAFAEDQFSQFIDLYPNDPEAPDATNWLGEAMIQRGAYTDAAQVLATGYTKYKDSKRAPDLLLKLGIALSAANQRDVACRTFSTLAQRYPNVAPAFKTRLSEENQKAQCPPVS